ncbi:uncharacterized protein RB166_013818 [Leptodactylus fuscus]
MSDAEASEQSASVLDRTETVDDVVQPTTSDGSHQQFPDLEAKLGQIMEQQRSTNTILENVTPAITESVTQQKEIVRLLKDIVPAQKKDCSAVYEMTVKRKPDEGND